MSVIEPGFMQGTGLSRERARLCGRCCGHCGISQGWRAIPLGAGTRLDCPRGPLDAPSRRTFVMIDKETEVAPFAHDRDRKLGLWEATVDLLEKAALADS